ncbi:hypothetical protein FB550_12357 [Neobacillus bataviensis]|uniref:Uncharacterized protein n=1 Tax=Neobacillus bataviensis TaxID=220685 RepID=A0A561CG81_9BACI|nr:hypothetical protein [Neobacillus bataviensis]TWD90235.1 hypothetical protein FB550_12357 [Neobacillus bataviensis]
MKISSRVIIIAFLYSIFCFATKNPVLATGNDLTIKNGYYKLQGNMEVQNLYVSGGLWI